MENVVQERVRNTENDKLNYTIQTFNKLSSDGLDILNEAGFTVQSERTESPDGFMLRSFSLHDYDLPRGLKAIGRAGAGVNNIPMGVCDERGIVVFNAPGANANAVKELVILGMLLASRDVVGGMNFVQSIDDQGEAIPSLVEDNKSKFKGFELMGKTLGVIGLGAIGYQVANAALGLGMDVQGYDPFISVNAAWELSSHVQRASSLEALIKTSDFITVHVPFNDQTKGFFSADKIQMLKRGATLLNFSRNGLVDEVAMEAALNNRCVNKYVSDFPNPKLVANAHVLSIPHLGASTVEAEDNCSIMVANQLKAFLTQGTIVNSVNFPNIHLDPSTDTRLVIINRNVPNIIGQITSILASNDLNISEMVNKSNGELACSLIDVSLPLSNNQVQQLMDVQGVVSVRQITNLC